MTQLETPGGRPPLGFGKIISESLFIFIGRFGLFFLLAFVPTLVSNLITAAAIGGDILVGEASDAAALEAMTSPTGIIFLTLLPLVFYVIAMAMIVLAAYDAKLGRPIRLGVYFSVAISRFIFIFLVSVILYVILIIGSVLLILPGLYLMALFSCSISSIVVERIGFGSLGRSIELTRGYRWPILGTLILMIIILVILSVAIQFVLLPLFLAIGSIWITIALLAAANSILSAILSITFVLIYARMREIKEGVGMSDLADVFS